MPVDQKGNIVNANKRRSVRKAADSRLTSKTTASEVDRFMNEFVHGPVSKKDPRAFLCWVGKDGRRRIHIERPSADSDSDSGGSSCAMGANTPEPLSLNDAVHVLVDERCREPEFVSSVVSQRALELRRDLAKVSRQRLVGLLMAFIAPLTDNALSTFVADAIILRESIFCETCNIPNQKMCPVGCAQSFYTLADVSKSKHEDATILDVIERLKDIDNEMPDASKENINTDLPPPGLNPNFKGDMYGATGTAMRRRQSGQLGLGMDSPLRRTSQHRMDARSIAPSNEGSQGSMPNGGARSLYMAGSPTSLRRGGYGKKGSQYQLKKKSMGSVVDMPPATATTPEQEEMNYRKYAFHTNALDALSEWVGSNAQRIPGLFKNEERVDDADLYGAYKRKNEGGSKYGSKYGGSETSGVPGHRGSTDNMSEVSSGYRKYGGSRADMYGSRGDMYGTRSGGGGHQQQDDDDDFSQENIKEMISATQELKYMRQHGQLADLLTKLAEKINTDAGNMQREVMAKIGGVIDKVFEQGAQLFKSVYERKHNRITAVQTIVTNIMEAEKKASVIDKLIQDARTNPALFEDIEDGYEELKTLLQKLVVNVWETDEKERDFAEKGANFIHATALEQDITRLHFVSISDAIEPRNWNEEYQQAYEKISEGDTLEAHEQLYQVAHDFVSYASLYGKVILAEIGVPSPFRTICPQDVGGKAGGVKYVHQGIFFKLAIDWKKYYGGDEFAMKVARHELKGVTAYARTKVKQMHHPLMALIDYIGYRLVALPVLPVGDDTIVYGSADGGETCFTSDKWISMMMKQAAERINLQGHHVSCEGHPLIHGPCDIEGHKGRDSRMYVLDYGRVFPPEPPQSYLLRLQEQQLKKRVGITLELSNNPQGTPGQGPPAFCIDGNYEAGGAFLYQLLRSELVKNNKVPLSSDAFTLFAKDDEESQVYEKHVTEAYLSLELNIIPKFGKWLSGLSPQQLDVVMDDISQYLHRQGINVRHMGLVESHIHVDALLSRKMMLTEMAARVCKNELRARLRDLGLQSTSVSDERFRILSLNFINMLLTGSEGSDEFWNTTMQQRIRRQFPRMRPNLIILKESIDVGRLIRRVCEMSGIMLSKEVMDMTRLGTDDAMLVEADIESMETRVAHLTYVNFSEGKALMMKSEISKSVMAEKRLERLAVQKFRDAVAMAPDDEDSLTALRDALVTLSKHQGEEDALRNVLSEYLVTQNYKAVIRLVNDLTQHKTNNLLLTYALDALKDTVEARTLIDEDIVIEACRLIGVVCQSYVNPTEEEGTRMLPVLLTLIKSEKMTITNQAAMALKHLAQTGMMGLRVRAQIMLLESEQHDVQVSAAHAIWQGASESEKYQEIISKTEGVAKIIWRMDSNNLTVSKICCGALWILMNLPENRRLFVKHEGILVIKKLLLCNDMSVRETASSALAVLSTNGGYVASSVDSGVIGTIAEALKTSSIKCLENLTDAFRNWTTTQNGKALIEIAATGASVSLQKLATLKNDKIVENARGVLLNFRGNDEPLLMEATNLYQMFKDMARQRREKRELYNGIQQRLLFLLTHVVGSINEHASDKAYELMMEMYENGHDELKVKVQIGLLLSPREDVQINACTILASVYPTGVNGISLASLGVILPLIVLLHAQHESVMKVALDTATTLSGKCDTCRSALYNEGVVRRLIELLEHHDRENRELSALCLANLAISNNVNIGICEEQAVLPLINIMRNGGEKEVEYAAKAIQLLSSTYENQKHIAELDLDHENKRIAIPSLVRVLGLSNPNAKVYAVGAIWNLVCNNKQRCYDAYSDEDMIHLIVLLEHESMQVKEYVAGILMTMTELDDEMKMNVAVKGALSYLLRLLSQKQLTKILRQRIESALSNIRQKDQLLIARVMKNVKAIISGGEQSGDFEKNKISEYDPRLTPLIEVLGLLLTSLNKEVIHYSTTTLRLLDSCGLEEIGIRVEIARLSSLKETIQIGAAGGIWNLCSQYPYLKDVFLAADGFSFFLKLLNSRNNTVVEQTATTLAVLVQDHVENQDVAGSQLMPSIFAALGSKEDRDTVDKIMLSLWCLSALPENRNRIKKIPNALNNISFYLDDNEVLFNVIGTLGTLCCDPEIRDRYLYKIRTDLREVLLQLLDSSEERIRRVAAYAFYNVSDIQEGGKENKDVQALAAQMLMGQGFTAKKDVIIRHSYLPAEIESVQGVIMMLKLLDSDDVNVLELACINLRFLIDHTNTRQDENKGTIMQEGGVYPLITVFRNKDISYECRLNCAVSMQFLVQYDDHVLKTLYDAQLLPLVKNFELLDQYSELEQHVRTLLMGLARRATYQT